MLTLRARFSPRTPTGRSTELQLVRSYPSVERGGVCDTQYLRIPDTGAIPCVLSQPTWLWGAEHGVNAHHVAIGNEKVYRHRRPVYEADPGSSAWTSSVLASSGAQRRRGDRRHDRTARAPRAGRGRRRHDGEPYWSSFLVVDPVSAWVLETCGRTWAARQLESAGAISNKLTIRTDWSRASADLVPGADFDDWRNPDAPTGHADRRLAASQSFLASALTRTTVSARSVVAHLRDHGSGPWGAPGSGGSAIEPPPAAYPRRVPG